MIQFAYQTGPPSTLQYHTLFYYLYYCCSYTVASVSPQFSHLPSLDSIILAYSHHFLQLFLIASAPFSFPTPPSHSSVCTLLSYLPTAVACSFSTLSFPTPPSPSVIHPFITFTYCCSILLLHPLDLPTPPSLSSIHPFITFTYCYCPPHPPSVANSFFSSFPAAVAVESLMSCHFHLASLKSTHRVSV